MRKYYYEIESELLEREAQRREVDKALCGRMGLPEEEVIRRQKEKWAAAWRRERIS